MNNQFASKTSVSGPSFHSLTKVRNWLLSALFCGMMAIQLSAATAVAGDSSHSAPQRESGFATLLPVSGCTVTVVPNQTWQTAHPGCVLSATAPTCGVPVPSLAGSNCMPSNGNELGILEVRDEDGALVARYRCLADGGQLVVVLIEG